MGYDQMNVGSRFHAVILGESFGFPNGMAAASRVRLLAKGLLHYGADITVLLSRATESLGSHVNTEVVGDYHGIHFEYTSGSTIRSSSWLLRRWDDIRGEVGAFWRLWQMKRQGKLDILLLYTRGYSVVQHFGLFSRFVLNVPVVLELCEWPMTRTHKRKIAQRNARQFCNKALRFVDAAVPISQFISEQIAIYRQNNKVDLPALTVPILTDKVPERHCRTDDRVGVEPYILFSGALSYMDILEILIKMCCELKKRSIGFLLKITGQGSDQHRTRLAELISHYDVGEYVEFCGFIPERELASMRARAVALLAPLPDNEQSASRFPTKIGECLACGRPLITNAVGDAGKYLDDGKNAFIAHDCSASCLADKVQEILSDYPRALKIGRAGRDLAERVFDYRKQGNRLGSFLEGIISQSASI
jgi:glycosyltransferase involved in cell wall biosynthesis